MPLPLKPWLTSYGPLPAALAGRIPVEPAFSERIRRAANRFYIDEMAAIRDEHDEKIARERACRLNEVMNDTVIAARTGVLSPTAARLLEACDTIFSATERKSAADQTSGGDRRPLPEVAFSTRRECGAGRSAVPESCGARTHHAGPTKGGNHEDLDASKSDFPLNPVGKLLQLRPGQDVAVFGDVAFDSRRA